MQERDSLLPEAFLLGAITSDRHTAESCAREVRNVEEEAKLGWLVKGDEGLKIERMKQYD